MAYPVVTYNASSGSDTAPSDAAASGTSASGTGAATTITLGETVDVSEDVLDDDSDYIYCDTTAGERHLFQITSFTGGTSTCTAVVVATAIGATTFSGGTWHINGTRKTINADTTLGDEYDLEQGWTMDLASGTYVHSSDFWVAHNSAGPNALEPGITIRAKSGASTKPKIQPDGNYKHFKGDGTALPKLKIIGIEFSCDSTNGGNTCYIDCSAGAMLTMIDCVVDNIDNVGTEPDYLFNAEFGNRSFTMVNCYMRGGTIGVVRVNQNEGIRVIGCHVDGDNSYGSTAGIMTSNGNQSNMVILDTLITECTGSGISIKTNNSISEIAISGCTIADNATDGIDIIDEAGTSDTTPMRSMTITNCLIANNAGWGLNSPTTASTRVQAAVSTVVAGIAFYNNTSGKATGQLVESIGEVVPTTTPFTSASDWSLNAVSTGGATCTDAAYPPVFPPVP